MAETFTFGADFDFSKGLRTANEATKKVEANFSKIKVDFDASGLNKLSGPLGKLSGQASEFTKSLEASNARVLAFGSSMGILATFSKGMKDLVSNGIEVQKTLAGINVVLNMSKEGLDSYSKQLFNVARNTGSNFKDIADGAKELARQGLGATESLKRLNDAAVLSRISGQSMSQSIGTLTSVINSYNKEVINSTDLTNKLANISSRFAISGKDIADALERVGSSAQDAGVNIDQLIALITSAQHITNRGGDVIGNALKSIFQRVERNDTVEQLQAIGVAARDVAGNTRSAVDILKSLSDVYPTLNKSQQVFITELTGGVFQANQLKAVINDLSTGYSTYKAALDASISSSKTAYEQNEKLNKTFASKTNAIGQDYKQVTGKYGEMVAGPAIDMASYFSKKGSSILMGEDKKGELEGADFAKAFFKGVGTFIAGPGAVIFASVVFGLIRKTSEFTKGAARNLIDVANGNDKVLDTQRKINDALTKSGISYSDLIAGARTRAELEERILKIISRQNLEREVQSGMTLELAQNKSARPIIGGRTPNFADPLREAIEREKKSGVSERDIYVDTDQRLASPSNPMGLLVANRRDEPLGGFQGVDRALAMGANPNIAQKIPNYAAYDKLTVTPGKTTLTGHESIINPEDARELRSKMAKLRDAAVGAEEAIAHGLTESINQFAKDIRLSDDSQKVITQTLSKHSVTLNRRIAEVNARPEALTEQQRNEAWDDQIKTRWAENPDFQEKKAAIARAQHARDMAERKKEQQRESNKRQIGIDNILHERLRDRRISESGVGSLPKSQRRSVYNEIRNSVSEEIFEGIDPSDLASNPGAQATIGSEAARRYRSMYKTPGAKALKDNEAALRAESLKSQREMDRRAQFTTRSIGMGIAGSMLAGGLSAGGMDGASGIVSGITTGAQYGGITGSVLGAGIGAGVGGGLAVAKAYADEPDRKFKLAAEEFQKMSAAISASTNSAENYIRTQQQFDELLKSGSASEKDINELSKSLTTLFSEITDNKLKSDILSAGTDIKLLGERLGEFAKTQKMILADKAIGVSVKGAEASRANQTFGFGGTYRSEDITEIARNVVGAGKVNKGNIGSLQERFKQLSGGQDEAGLNETLKSLSIPMEGIHDFFARLELLGKAINEYDLAEQGKRMEESSKNYLNSLAKFQMEFSNLMNTRSIQREVGNVNMAAGQQVALSRANTAFSGFSGGLTDSAKLPFEVAMKLQQINFSGEQKTSSLDAQTKASLTDIVRTSLAPAGMMGMMSKIDSTGSSPEDIIGELLKKEVGEFQGDKLKTAKEQLNKTLDEYRASTEKITIEQGKELALLKEETTVRREAIRRQSLINSFGGTGTFGKPIDVSGFAAGEKASAAVQHGDYLLGYRSMNEYQKADLGASMNQARTTQALSQIELSKMFPEAKSVRGGSIQNNVATAIEYERRQKLAQLTAGRLQSTFSGALNNNQLAGDVNASAIGGVAKDIFNLLKSVGPDGKSRGENRDYEGAGRATMQRYGIGSENPMYKQVMEILGQAKELQEGIREGAELSAKEMLPGAADEKQVEIFNKALRATPLENISTYTKQTSDRILELTAIMAERGKVESASGIEKALNTEKGFKYQKMSDVQNSFDRKFSSIFSIGKGDVGIGSDNDKKFSALSTRISGRDDAAKAANSTIRNDALLGSIAIKGAIGQGGSMGEIFERIKADKSTEAFTRLLSPDDKGGVRDRKIKELIVGMSAGEVGKKVVGNMLEDDSAISKLESDIKDMSSQFEEAAANFKKANESLEETINVFNKKTLTDVSMGDAGSGSGGGSPIDAKISTSSGGEPSKEMKEAAKQKAIRTFNLRGTLDRDQTRMANLNSLDDLRPVSAGSDEGINRAQEKKILTEKIRKDKDAVNKDNEDNKKVDVNLKQTVDGAVNVTVSGVTIDHSKFLEDVRLMITEALQNQTGGGVAKPTRVVA